MKLLQTVLEKPAHVMLWVLVASWLAKNFLRQPSSPEGPSFPGEHHGCDATPTGPATKPDENSG